MHNGQGHVDINWRWVGDLWIRRIVVVFFLQRTFQAPPFVGSGITMATQ